MYAIEANGIQKNFGKLTVLRNISMNLKKGEVVVLLGPNGAGKSTLLKIFAGLYKPTFGTVKVFGEDLQSNTDKIRYSMSFLGENYALYDDLTARKNLQFFGRLYDIDANTLKKRIINLMNKFDAVQYIDRNVGELSRGTKQKIALCRALINEPKLLLLDEPSAFLDPIASKILHKELNRLSSEGVSIIYATQRLDELYRIGDKTLLIRKGKDIAFGPVDKILNKLEDVEVEIILSRPISPRTLATLGRKWEIRQGDSKKSIVFSLKLISQIPSVVRDVVKNKGEIVSVLHLKESIDKILEGR